MTTHKHILQLEPGITVEATMDDDTGQFSCQWSPSIPHGRKLLERITPPYEAWRNRIISEWAHRKGKRVIVFSSRLHGKPQYVTLGP